MIGTLSSTLIAIYFLSQRLDQGGPPNLVAVGVVMIIVATISVMILPFLQAMVWAPLQHAEERGAPRLLELLSKDRHLQYIKFWTVLFPLVSYLSAVDLIFLDHINEMALLAIWLVMFGITIDVVYHAIKRVFIYLSPHSALEIYSKEAHHAITEEHYQQVCHWVDALAEMSAKAITTGQLSLSLESVDEMQSLTRHFLHSCKSITHHKEAETEAVGSNGDIVNFMLSYIFERLDICHVKALEERSELMITHLINTLGKMTLAAAEYDISVAIFPLHYINKATLRSMEEGLFEIPSKTTCTLVEVAKLLPKKVDLRFLTITDFYGKIISLLDCYAKEIFKRDKKQNLTVLVSPFKEIKKIFEEGVLKEHQDQPIILKELDNEIEQFEALSSVMGGMFALSKESRAEPVDDMGLSEKVIRKVEERYGLKSSAEEEGIEGQHEE